MADDDSIDTTGLTDADWAEIEAADPLDSRYGRLLSSMIRETLKAAMAETGMTEEDLRDRVRELERPARDQ